MRLRLKEAIVGIVLILALVFALSNPNITGLFWQSVNELSYEKDINLTLNSSSNLTVELESPSVPRLISFKLTGKLNGNAEIYLKSADKTYLIASSSGNFEDKCEETCSIDEFNQTSFELIVKLNGTLELKKASYAVQNLTWIDEEKAPEIDEEVVEEAKEEKKVDVIVILEEPKGKKFAVSGNKDSIRKEKIRFAQDEFKKLLNKDKTKISHEYSNINAISLSITEEELEKLKSNANVKKIVKDKEVRASLTESVPLINADDAWGIKVNGINLTGKGVTVCVIDTGIAYNHSDLGNSGFPNAKVIGGHNYCANESCSAENNDPYDNNGHGTHVAGIVAANGNLKGVAPEAKLVAMKVLNSNGSGEMSDTAAAIDWCVENKSKFNISVITMSLGDNGIHTDLYNECRGLSAPDGGLTAAAIDSAIAKNIFVVAASGNNNASNGIAYPACAPNSTSVGASTKTDQIATITNIDEILNMLAPGSAINSTVPKGSCILCDNSGYYATQGTSMATPHVAGAAALIYQKEKLLNHKNATPSVVKELLKTRTNVFASRAGMTFPRINILQAVNGVLQVNSTENSLKSDEGKVKFGSSTDLTKASEAFIIGDNSIFLNSSNYPEFDKPANLTIFKLSFEKTPVALKDGAVCLDCEFVSYDGENYTFEVTGFSNYTAGANANLHIFDENDPEGGWMNRTTHEDIVFYANYSNKTSGAPVTAGICNISFSDLNDAMSYNASTKFFEFRRNFTTAGPYYYNISCNETSYEYLKTSDDIAVLPGCGLPPPGVNWTINGSSKVTCENEVLYFKNQTLILKDNSKLILYNTTLLLKDSRTNYDILINGSEFNISHSIFSSQTIHLFSIHSYKKLNFDNVSVNKTSIYIESGNSTLKNSKFYNVVFLRGVSKNLLYNDEFFDDVWAEDTSQNKMVNTEFNDFARLRENSNNEINETLFKNALYIYDNSKNNFTLPQSNVSQIGFYAGFNQKIYGYVNMPSSVSTFNAIAIVQRFYPVHINYTNGSIAINKYVNVTNGTNILWQGYTDSQGIAYPNLTFIQATYTKTYNVSTNPKKPIAMLTDTPILFTLDASAPVLDISLPQNNSLLNTKSLTLNYSAYDETAISQCWYINVTGGRLDLPSCQNISFSGQEGRNNITLYANDTSNNIASEQVFFTIDTVPPNVSLESPANNTLRTIASTTFEYNVSDEGGSINYCQLIITGNVIDIALGVAEGVTQSFTQTLANDVYTWWVNCTDNTGNTGTSAIFNLTVAVPSSPGSTTEDGGGRVAPYIGPPKPNETAIRTPTEEEKKLSKENGVVEEPEADPVVLSPSTVNPTGKGGRSGIIRYWYALLLLPLLLLLLWPKGTLIADSGTIGRLVSENRIKKYRKIYTLKENCEKYKDLKNLVAFELEKKYEWKADLINKTYRLPPELCKDITFALTHYTHRIRKKKVFTMEKIPELYSREFKKIEFVNPFEERK